MKFVLLFVSVVLLAVVLRKLFRYKTLAPLLPRKYNFGKRRDTLREVLRLLDERGARILLETGVARMGLEKSKGDGASTIVFGLWANNNDAHLYSVDIDPDATRRAGVAVDAMGLAEIHLQVLERSHCPRRQPVTTDLVPTPWPLLGHEHRQSGPGGDDGRGRSGGSGPDDGEVDAGGGGHRPSLQQPRVRPRRGDVRPPVRVGSAQRCEVRMGGIR